MNERMDGDEKRALCLSRLSSSEDVIVPLVMGRKGVQVDGWPSIGNDRRQYLWVC